MGWTKNLSQVAAAAFYSMQFDSTIHKAFPCSLQHVKIQYINDYKIPPASYMAD